MKKKNLFLNLKDKKKKYFKDFSTPKMNTLQLLINLIRLYPLKLQILKKNMDLYKSIQKAPNHLIKEF